MEHSLYDLLMTILGYLFVFVSNYCCWSTNSLHFISFDIAHFSKFNCDIALMHINLGFTFENLQFSVCAFVVGQNAYDRVWSVNPKRAINVGIVQQLVCYLSCLILHICANLFLVLL